MYVPPHFDEPRREVLHDLIEKAPLGTLFTHGRSGMDANHIPFHLARDEGANGVLHCHVARANPVWQDIASGDAVLVVFRAADAYISPNWYPSKRESRNRCRPGITASPTRMAASPSATTSAMSAP